MNSTACTSVRVRGVHISKQAVPLCLMPQSLPITRRAPSALGLGPGWHLHASVRALGPPPGAQRRPRVACRAGGVEEDGDDGGRPDIDALASYLSREAARLRDASSSAPGGGSSGSGGGGDAAEDRPLLVPHSDEIEGRLLEQVWGGGSAGRPSRLHLLDVSLGEGTSLGSDRSDRRMFLRPDGPLWHGLAAAHPSVGVSTVHTSIPIPHSDRVRRI